MTTIMPPTEIPGHIMNAFTRHDPRPRRSGNGWSLRCPVPAHGGDKNPSLSLTREGDRLLLHCMKGCTPEAVVQVVGLTMADLFLDGKQPLPFPPAGARPHRNGSQAGELVAVYQYRDLSGEVVAEKGRFELPELGPDGKRKKTFLWRRAGAEGWRGLGSLAMADLALWGSDLLADAPLGETVYYVEGEKAALACREAGLLAVTHAGGASTKDFGASLECLRGRRVALWPDNDASGREYMATVHARLRDLAADLRVVAVPLPAKGDAADFFAAGGTVAQLEGGALPVGGPSVEYLEDDAIRVRATSPLGEVSFKFADIEKTASRFNSLLSIIVEAPGFRKTPYVEHIDLNSNNQITTMRRSLDTVYGASFKWTELVNEVIGLARESYQNYDYSVDLFDIEPIAETELFFHAPLVPLNSITIFFGDRASTKSYLTIAIMLAAAFGEPFLGAKMPFVKVLVIDYEDNERNYRRRINRVAEGMGLALLPGMIHYLNLKGKRIVDMVGMVKKKVRDEGIGLVIIDSLAPATGDEPEKAGPANAAMQALRKIGVTVIALAHVPKNHMQQPENPFGSIYYGNLSRRMWYVEKAQDEAADIIDVGLFCKKVSDGPYPRPIALTVEFAGLNGPVTLSAGRVQDVAALQEQRPMKDRLWDALEQGRALTVKQLAVDLGANEKEVANALAGNRRLFARAGELQPEGRRGRSEMLWGRAALP